MNILEAVGAVFKRRVYVSGEIKTRGDAARAASELGQRMIGDGFSQSEASDLVSHEFTHAVADERRYSSPGRIIYVRPPMSDTGHAFYRTDPSDSENYLKVLTAPDRLGFGSPMSKQDKKGVHEVLKQIRESLRNK